MNLLMAAVEGHKIFLLAKKKLRIIDTNYLQLKQAL